MKEISWKDITLEDKVGIDNVITSDLSENNKIRSYVYIVFGKEIDDIPLKDLNDYMNGLNFLNTPIPVEKIKKEYVINGKKYVMTKDINKLTSGQYLDYMNLVKAEPIEYHKLLATLLIPKGHKYCDGYEMEDVYNDMLQINCVDLNSISNFLVRQSLKCIKNLEDYSILQIWKTKGLTLKKKILMTNLADKAMKAMELSITL